MIATFREVDRDAILARIERLRPDRRPRWGTMSASEMICHLADQLRIALGEIPAASIRSPLRLPGLKQFVLYVAPWPKARVAAPPESRTTRPQDWARDLDTLRDLVHRFAARDRRDPTPPHPLFGQMSGRSWADFTRRHFDHHLRQFGV